MISTPTRNVLCTYRHFKIQTKTSVESRDVNIYKELRTEIGALMHEELALSVATQSDPMLPKNFKKAWDHSDITERDR